jgi:two-component system chemotaxis sensor kinase CheA
LSEFVAEANEILEALGRELLTLDAARGQEIDPDTLNAVFRAAHSLKGLSAMFGQERLSRLAHHAEDLLDALRLGKAPLDDVALDLLVETLDVLQALLVESAQGEASQDLEVRAETMGERLRGVAAGSSVGAVDVLEQVGIDPGLRAVFTEYEEHRLRENVKKGVGLWKVRAVYQLSDFDTRLAALNQVLKALGEVVSTLPSSQPGGDDTIAFDLVFGSGKPRDAILSALAGEATLEPLTTRALPPAAPPTSSPRKLPLPARSAPPLLRAVAPGEEAPLLAPGGFRGSEPSLRSLTQTVRVDIGRLDGLMNSIGELLLIRGNIQRLAEVARQTGAVALPKLWAQELQREARALERKLDELQKGVLEVRMVPLVQVFDKLTRLMRRLVRDSGKDVEFEVSGGDVELDKLIVEELSDPLMHLLRNALDHGVEAPEAREKVGKPRRAKIRMRAQQQGNHVSIEVGDDGAGMDEARIRQVAVERGVVTLEQSGRGVGLDVVKTNLQRLSGLIDVQSRRHEGSSFVLTLPLTLAIIRALMVQVSGRTYAVPLNSVLETLAVKTSELRTVERREVFTLRGQTLPFVRLSRLFKLEEAPLERHLVVIIGLAQQRFGLAVDALLGQQDIVTKPLGGRLSRIPGVAGATELGDRRAVLVLDVSTLMEELLRPSAAAG